MVFPVFDQNLDFPQSHIFNANWYAECKSEVRIELSPRIKKLLMIYGPKSAPLKGTAFLFQK